MAGQRVGTLVERSKPGMQMFVQPGGRISQLLRSKVVLAWAVQCSARLCVLFSVQVAGTSTGSSLRAQKR